MADQINREIHLASRPQGWPWPANFRLVETPLPEAAEGQVLVRNVYMSVDPYMRGRMNARRSYAEPYEVGHAMYGGAIGRVLVSRTPVLAVGDVVLSNWGWREYFVSDGSDLERIEPQAPLSYYLGVLGMPGLTAYVGLYDLAEPQPGETVFVSAASGAVGSVVGQLARIRGCTVIGSVGSEEKLRYVRDDLGFDAAFNYQVTSPEQALAELAPDGIDVYFDNVGSDHLQAAIGAMRMFGRITICGMISIYNATAPEPGPNNLILMLTRRLRMRGFIVTDHADRQAAFREAVGGYLQAGRLIVRETIVDGIEHAPEAILSMMRGDHIGKVCVRLAPDQDGA
jgi:NADPH-dependent curcumin reductase CurA